ncbi:MAG: PilN domain-containing protein [Ghiorsea sp.]
MIRINLLPHRAEFRQQQIIEHVIVFVAMVLLAITLVIAVDVVSTKGLTTLQDEFSQLKAKNTQLSRKIGELRNLDSLRQDVEGKLEIVDELQAGRFRSLNTLYAIAMAIPQNIWLERLRDKGNSLELSGFGESSKAIANFMRSIGASEVFDTVVLGVDQSADKDGVQMRKFSLTFRRLSLAEQAANTARKKAEAEASKGGDS